MSLDPEKLRDALSACLLREDIAADPLGDHIRAALGAPRRPGNYGRCPAAAIAAVYLPPYSPDDNPIELAFAKVKARLRAAELRTIDRVEAFFGPVHEAFPPSECGNYIRHAGYTATDLPKAL